MSREAEERESIQSYMVRMLSRARVPSDAVLVRELMDRYPDTATGSSEEAARKELLSYKSRFRHGRLPGQARGPHVIRQGAARSRATSPKARRPKETKPRRPSEVKRRGRRRPS